MAQQIDYTYSVTEKEAAHYDEVRRARGWTWDELADNLERVHPEHHDPFTPNLIAYCRAQGKGDKSARAKKSAERETR